MATETIGRDCTRQPIKCLSLWQPWASLIAFGEKQIETRSWGTNYRGLIAIHAAKRWTQAEKRLCLDDPFYSSLRKRVPLMTRKGALPLGAIIAVARLTEIVRMRGMALVNGGVRLIRESEHCPPRIGRDRTRQPYVHVSAKEAAFGRYEEDRFAWILSDIRALPEPIPFKGMQGLFTLTGEAHERLIAFQNDHTRQESKKDDDDRP